MELVGSHIRSECRGNGKKFCLYWQSKHEELRCPACLCMRKYNTDGTSTRKECALNDTEHVHYCKLQGAAEIVKHFKNLVTCFSARVSRNAGVRT
jgi:hypothetical protein